MSWATLLAERQFLSGSGAACVADSTEQTIHSARCGEHYTQPTAARTPRASLLDLRHTKAWLNSTARSRVSSCAAPEDEKALADPRSNGAGSLDDVADTAAA